MIRPEFEKLVEAKRIYWGKDGNAQPSVIRFLSEVEGLVPWTWWPHGEVGHTDESKKEANALFGADVSFGTPKPERLLQRILHIATNPGDLVLDSFLGSGTTAAVAHKMGRRWIGIEMGDHAVTHCAPRLNKVIAGEGGGISRAVDWQGGGGFDFYRLGPAVFDADGTIAAGIAFCSEDRKGEGILADLSVRDNLVLAVQARRGWARPVPRRAKDELDRIAKDGEAGEDDVRRAEKELDNLTEQHVAHVDEAMKNKESELLEV